MENKRVLLLVMILIFAAALISFSNVDVVSGAQKRSNESIQAADLIDKAMQCYNEMVNRGVGLTRANETLQEALQLYSGQVILEAQGRKADYKIINNDATEVCAIKDAALKAQDELAVFNESYTKAALQINLSGMDKEYNDVIKSFSEERFEDTSSLINAAYSKMSEVQASQTALKLFYETTTRTIKDFFRENWKSLSIGTTISLILLIVFWKALRRWIIKHKLNHLNLRKESINELIKKMQKDYFKSKKLSETEFGVKLTTFKEMIRGIDAQILELKERLAKIALEEEKEKEGGKVFKRH